MKQSIFSRGEGLKKIHSNNENFKTTIPSKNYDSLIAHTAKIVAKILRRRIEKKIEDVLGEDQFGFRRGKGTRDTNGMLRIISERTLEMDEELSVWFIDWQKAFYRVNWTKLMQILKETGIDWRERKLISSLYMAQSVKVRLN